MASKAAKQVWRRMTGWYGAAKLAEQYGPEPPEDWCKAIDAAAPAAVEGALQAVRRDHAVWPPTLGQFEAALDAATSKPPVSDTARDLCQYVVRNRRLTGGQLRASWTYLARNTGQVGPAGKPLQEVVGVLVPADGDAPGYRVMVDDMRAGV